MWPSVLWLRVLWRVVTKFQEHLLLKKTEKMGLSEIFVATKHPIPHNTNLWFFLCYRYCLPLPRLTEECYRVVVIGNLDTDSTNYNLLDVFKVVFMVGDVRLSEDCCLGDIYVVDLANFGLGHIAKMTITALRKLEVCAMVRSVHVHPTTDSLGNTWPIALRDILKLSINDSLFYRIPQKRAARKVSSHFEYLENRSRGLDVTWQPVRGDLTAHPCNSESSVGASQSAVRRRWLNLCTVWPSHSQWPSEQISFIRTLRLPILQHLWWLSYFWAKQHITQFCKPPLQPRFGSLRILTFPKGKIAVEMEEICERDGHKHDLRLMSTPTVRDFYLYWGFRSNI